MKTILLSFLFLCQLVENHVTIDFNRYSNRVENPYDNGYPEERYHQVLDTLTSEFQGEALKRGGSFHILRDWGDGAVNAWAWRIGDEFWIEVPGGMSRYHLINEEGFLTVLCHELGHLFGGSPHGNEISYEGQADYYSTMKCVSRVFHALGYPEKPSQYSCQGKFCDERLKGAESLSSYYAFLGKDPLPSLGTPDRSSVNQTNRAHPRAQCRFDTMVAGLQCSNREDFSYRNFQDGACMGTGARPRCWFSPGESL